LSSPYENPLPGAETYQNNYQNYSTSKPLNVAEKDHDLLYKPSYKESLQLKSDYSYESTKPPTYKTS
jgi:hypothetical protein